MVTIDKTADCTVRAIACTTDLDWFQAERAMKAAGYVPGEGASIVQTALCAWNILGRKPEFPGKAVYGETAGTVGKFAKAYPDRKAIAFGEAPGGYMHAMGIKNGRAYNLQACTLETEIVAVFFMD